MLIRIHVLGRVYTVWFPWDFSNVMTVGKERLHVMWSPSLWFMCTHYSSQHLKWFKNLNQSCPKNRTFNFILLLSYRFEKLFLSPSNVDYCIWFDWSAKTWLLTIYVWNQHAIPPFSYYLLRHLIRKNVKLGLKGRK